MVDPVLFQQLGQVEKMTPPESAQGPGRVEQAQVDRFEAALAQSPADLEGGQGIRPPDNLADSADAAADFARTPPPAMPDRLLSGLDAFSAESDRMRAHVVQTLGTAGEMGDMFRLQFEVANLTTTQTMVGQTGQKGSQGVQTLLKGQ